MVTASLVRISLSIAVALGLCASPLAAQLTRDSAGFRIVDNAEPAWTSAERLSLDATPRLVIGDTADSRYRFGRVQHVMRMTDGRIAVVDKDAGDLRFFSADGRFRSTHALQPEGTVRRSSLGLVRRLRGDTIAIATGSATLSLFTGQGDLVRNIGARDVRGGPPPFLMVDALDDARRVVTPFPDPEPHALGARWVDSTSMKVLAESGEVERELGTFAYAELEQERSGLGSPWLSAIGVFAAGDNRFFAGFGDRYEIRVFTSDGTPHMIIRRQFSPVPITSEDWTSWVEQWSKLWVRETGAARDSAIARVHAATYADVLPAFCAFLIDRTGRLWVRSAHWEDAVGAGSYTDTPAVPSQWSVFDKGGDWLGDVEMPAHFQPFEIGTDYVAGKARRNGVNSVVIYALKMGNA